MELLGNSHVSDGLQKVQSELLRSLPFNYQSFKVTEDKRPIGFRFYKSNVTIEAQLNGKEIIVCGEDSDPSTATAKALSELIERSTLITYISKNPLIARTSNGWAAHVDEEQAKLNAVLEVIERDAVLAQWFSATPFLEIDCNSLPSSILSWANSELSNSEFPILKVLISTNGIGPSVTCLFMNASGFGVCGHSCKVDLASTIENAIGEACRAAHLSLRNSYYADTEILKTRPVGTKINPGAHAVYYAYHEAFPNWMFGEKISWSEALKLWGQRIAPYVVTKNLDFEIETVLTDPVFVCFAKHQEAFELSWGSMTSEQIRKTNAGRRLAEIEINLKPHPIS